MPTVIATPLTETEQSARAAHADRDLLVLLRALVEGQGAPISTLAEQCGWTSAGGVPNKAKVHRLLNELKTQGFATKELNSWSATAKGEKAANRGR